MPALISTFLKTPTNVLLAFTQQATAVITVGSAVDVSTKGGGLALIQMGRINATALGNEVKFRLEVSAKSSGNDAWFPYVEWTSSNGKTAGNATTLNGATTAGNTTSILTSGTGFISGTAAYFRETGTPANSEWSRILSTATNTVTFEEAQTRNHTNSIAVTTLGEYFAKDLDFTVGITRVRLVVDTASAAAGQTVDIIAWLNTFDSVSSV